MYIYCSAFLLLDLYLVPCLDFVALVFAAIVCCISVLQSYCGAVVLWYNSIGFDLYCPSFVFYYKGIVVQLHHVTTLLPQYGLCA